MTAAPLRRIALSTGVELGVQVAGPDDGDVLIFLHGFPESHRTWRHQIPHFSDRYRCIAPDQRGYRGSSKPQDVGSYSPDAITADVFALADALGVDQFTIVGHDWGGAMAWNVILSSLADGQKPEWASRVGRVKAGIIANAPHPYIFQHLLLTDPAQRAASQYMRAFRDPAHDELVRTYGLGALLQKVVAWGSSPHMEPEERAALLADWQDGDTAIAMLNWYRATQLVVPSMDDPYPEFVFDPASVPRITIPMLVVWGMGDLALPPCNIRDMDKVIDDLTLVKVEDCPHFVPWQAPAAMNAAMDSFLARS